MSDERKACDGYPTIPQGDMEECAACGKRVAWDFIEHPLFGFQTCEKKEPR